MTEKRDWNVQVTFDHRFNAFGFHFQSGEDQRHYSLPLGQLLKSTKVSREELLAMIAPEYQWTEGMHDIDGARVRLLESVDWKGKTVLDIGGYDGFAAEIAHKGGAARAICLDNHQYEHYGWKDVKKEGVEYVTGDVMGTWASIDQVNLKPPIWSDTAPFDVPRPDTIINYNVLYHIKNPWAFLDKCREIIKEDGEMLLCTLFRYMEGPWMYVYDPRECNPTDDTVYFGPSLEAIERLLKHTGWEAEQYALAYDRVLYRCKPTPGFKRTHEDS